MKTSTKFIGALLITMSTFFACEKSEVKKEAEEQKYSVALNVVGLKGEVEKGILVGAKAELEKALTADGAVAISKASKANQLFIPPIGDTPPADPWVLCKSEIDAYYAEHIAQWQAQANSTCKDVIVCLTCPNANGGLFVLYVIKPNSIRCTTLVADAAIRFGFSKFDFGVGDYEGTGVSSYIRKLESK